jgi:DnaJ domain
LSEKGMKRSKLVRRLVEGWRASQPEEWADSRRASPLIRRRLTTDQEPDRGVSASYSGTLDPAAPGMVRGRHFTTYVEEVKELKRRREYEAAELLLLALVGATEAEDSVDRLGVAPWYYEQLAIVYGKRRDLDSEIAILERYEQQRHALGGKPSSLLRRLQRARGLADTRTGKSPARPRPAPPQYEVEVGADLSEELFSVVRRPMIKRIRFMNDSLVGWPDQGVRSPVPVAFDLLTGEVRGLDETVAAAVEGADTGIRWDRVAIGRGPCALTFTRRGRVISTATVPDAISQIADGVEGWYVGCRDGYLYFFGSAGDLRWRWELPGSQSSEFADATNRYFRPCPYYVVSAGGDVFVSSWGSVWSLSPDGVENWRYDLKRPAQKVSLSPGIPFRRSEAAGVLHINEAASEDEVRAAYRRRAIETHPDLHPDDPEANDQFIAVQQAYETLAGSSALEDEWAITIIGPSQTVTFMEPEADQLLVGGSAGDLVELSSKGHVLGIRNLGSRVVPLRDGAGSVVAFGAQPNLWLRGLGKPVPLPDAYQWPGFLVGVYGKYVLAHRRNERHAALIDLAGHLRWKVTFSRPITDVAVSEDVLAVAAGATVMFRVPGLSLRGLWDAERAEHE